MEVRTWSYTNAFGEEQEVMEFRTKNGDGSNQYVEVHALLNAFAESTLNFLKVEKVIKCVPKSDVAPVVRGKWLKKGQTLYMCSKCCRVIDAYSDLSKTVEKFPYCHCGARMDLQ